jgi:hypothetical protein
VASSPHYGRCSGRFEQPRFHAAALQNRREGRGVLSNRICVAREIGHREKVDELGDDCSLVRLAPLPRRIRRRVGLREGASRRQ